MKNKNQDLINNKLKPKKINNIKIYDLISNKLSEDGKERFKDCSTYNEFIATEDKNNMKLIYRHKCGGGKRFCPICTWVKSCKDTLQLSIVMEAIRIEQNKEFLFLTLTTPNINGENLKLEVDKFNKAFNKLFKRSHIVKSIKGYTRKLEITYDKERFITKDLFKRKKYYYTSKGLKIGDNNPTYDTYNPHFHVLLCVNKSYFTDKKYYIKHEKWLNMWQEVTNIPEITQVYIQKVKQTRGSEIAEIAKYSAKDSEMGVSQDIFDNFYEALKRRQLIVYGGLLKEYVKKYKDGDLDKYKAEDEKEYFYKLIAVWQSKNKNFTKEYEELTDSEKENYNKNLIDEIEVK